MAKAKKTTKGNQGKRSQIARRGTRIAKPSIKPANRALGPTISVRIAQPTHNGNPVSGTPLAVTAACTNSSTTPGTVDAWVVQNDNNRKNATSQTLMPGTTQVNLSIPNVASSGGSTHTLYVRAQVTTGQINEAQTDNIEVNVM
jgi:hypothetical protein